MEISAGKYLTQKNDKLFRIQIEYLYQRIQNPKPELIEQISQLRTVQNISPEKYKQLKTQLPYVVAACFDPPFRKTVNFAFTHYFILDIDHLTAQEKDITTLKNEMSQDPRVKLIFLSPGGNGLKVFLQLDQACYDTGKYTLFYKVFALAFARQYNLLQNIDTRTADITRACFISYDPQAFFNPDAIPVMLSDFLDFNQLDQIKQTQHQIVQHEKQLPALTPEKQQIPPDKLQEIKQKLNPNIRTHRKKQIYVPPELEQAIEKVQQQMQKHQIEITEIINIHYGKKFRFQLDDKKAEINLFYGKKGYSVVISPKTGTNSRLNEVCHQILCEIFY